MEAYPFVANFCAETVVKELLGCIRERSIREGCEDERPLDSILTGLDGILGCCDAIDRYGLYGIKVGSERCIANRAGVLGDSRDDSACGSELLAVLACILDTDDFLEAAPRAGSSLPADGNDRRIRSADLAPVGDSAREEARNLVDREVRDRVAGIHDDSDAIICEDSLSEAGLLLAVLEGA